MNTYEYRIVERYTLHERKDCKHYLWGDSSWGTSLSKAEAEKRLRETSDYYAKYGRVFALQSREVGEWGSEWSE